MKGKKKPEGEEESKDEPVKDAENKQVEEEKQGFEQDKAAD